MWVRSTGTASERCSLIKSVLNVGSTDICLILSEGSQNRVG